MRRQLALAAASLALALPLSAHAEVTDVAGVKYENTITLGNTKLQLNGAGIRYKYVVKVYTAGLYLQAKAMTPDGVYGTAPRRIHVVMLREVNADELGRLFTRGIEENLTREEFAKVIPAVIRMSDVFGLRKRLLPGDAFTVDYVPGTGSVISINGQRVPEPIKEPEFYDALMKIWLGRSPADAQLKDALLGRNAGKDPFARN
jgi:hypothetical protein